MSSLQKSIWSSDELSSVHHRQSFSDDSKQNINNNQLSINVWSNETLDDGINNSNKLGSPIWCFIRCCILGSLLTGITLAIVLTLWLTNGNIISQASSTTTSDILTITTTTETTTTTSVTSPLTLPPAPCRISSPYSTNTLLYITNPTTIVYTCYAFIWTSSVSGTVNLNFQFRQDTNYWYLDEVNVYAVGGTQMLVNGGFEMGSLYPWIRTPPSASCAAPSLGAQVAPSSPYAGNYNLQDKCKLQIDKISQSFMVNAAQPYLVSFYLRTGSLSLPLSVNVSIS